MNKEMMDTSENTMEVKDSLLEVSEKIKGLKFRKKLFGGVDILDVWRKLSQIDKGYQDVMKVQKEFYEDKLEEKEKKILELEREIEVLKKGMEAEVS